MPVSPEPSPTKAVAPTVPTTCNLWVGDHVPTPTLPFMTTIPPTGVEVPMPILEPTVGK